jgi:hypothetical protein
MEGAIEQSHFGEVGHLSVREYYRCLEEDAMALWFARIRAGRRGLIRRAINDTIGAC